MMNVTSKHTNWTEKYRPKRLEDVVLPALLKRQLIGLRDSEQSYNLALYGYQGTGKTTTAKLINPASTVSYNCATELRGDGIHNLEKLCTSHSVCGGKRIVLLDEADNLKPASQSALKNIIERCSSTTMFILTTNYIEKLSAPLRSRFKEVDFSIEAGDVMLRQSLKRRLLEILSNEGVAHNNQTIETIIREHFPDMRKTVIELQCAFGFA